MTGSLVTTCRSLAGGVDTASGVGGIWTITTSGNWVLGETFSITLTNSLTGETLNLGAGTVTGVTPVYALTYNKKLNLLFNTTWAFSAVNQPTQFNDLNSLGSGSIELSDAYSEADTVQAIVPYQGRVAIFGKNHIQIWQIDADPVNYQLMQVLENVGTIAKLSPKSLGELDIFFLHKTGVRSLRVRDISLNAMLVDIGSPIDSLIQAALASATPAVQQAACGIIEPITGQYWLYLNGTIYVLSYFPSAKINAWAKWIPSYSSDATTASYVLNSDATLSVVVKFGLINDPTKAEYSYIITAGAYQSNLAPAKYCWVYAADGTTLLSSTTLSTGLFFMGLITVDHTGLLTAVSAQTTFVPQKFVSFEGQVYVRTADAFFMYGGADNATYDNSLCAWETSWLDADAPANEKLVHGVDVAQSGTWAHFASTDYLTGYFTTIMASETAPTFDGGKIDFSARGTHIKYRAQTIGLSGRALVSNLLFHYTETKQK